MVQIYERVVGIDKNIWNFIRGIHNIWTVSSRGFFFHSNSPASLRAYISTVLNAL